MGQPTLPNLLLEMDSEALPGRLSGLDEAARPHGLKRCEMSGCGASFFLPGRRHHCRSCGASVCSAHFARPSCLTCSGGDGAIALGFVEKYSQSREESWSHS